MDAETPFAPPDPPTAAEMVATIRRAIAANPVGVVTVSVDGQTTTWDHKTALDMLRHWQGEQAREEGRRPRVARMNLSGF